MIVAYLNQCREGLGCPLTLQARVRGPAPDTEAATGETEGGSGGTLR